jgi:hypothetical protein
MKPRDRTQMHTFRVLDRGMLTLLRRKSVWVELCTVAGLIFVLAFFSSGDVGRARSRLAQTMSPQNVPSNDGYVGSTICAECHGAIYSKFSQTDMGWRLSRILCIFLIRS